MDMVDFFFKIWTDYKDWILFFFGIVLGFFFSIAVYWMPLGQFKNECMALCSLLKKKYQREDVVTIRSGVDLKPVNSSYAKLSISNDFKMQVANDEGVGWHHTSRGWVRARILHVYNPDAGSSESLYKVCHLDLV